MENQLKEKLLNSFVEENKFKRVKGKKYIKENNILRNSNRSRKCGRN